jgi:hypothetical protein
MSISPTLAFEGHAIVSANGMIADGDGAMPPALRNDADWRLFQAALDEASFVVVGSIGHMRHRNPGRRRLVLTRSVATLAPDPVDKLAQFWNPAGLPVEKLLDALGITTGTIAVTGGTGVFDFFLSWFTAFSIAEVPGLVLPGGTPCFSAGTPKVALAGAGLRPGVPEVIDRAAGVTLTRWVR